jgi:L-galactose dehydrogenase
LIRDLNVYLAPVLEEHGIGLVNASPLHMGILTSRGAPPWHPAPERVKQAGKRIVELSASRGVELAAAALQFCLDHSYISSTFIGMSKPEHVDSNVKAVQRSADPEFLAAAERAAGEDLNISWPSGLAQNQD